MMTACSSSTEDVGVWVTEEPIIAGKLILSAFWENYNICKFTYL